MTSTSIPEKKVHHGRAVKRLREILYIKQDLLASELDMSQQNMSVLEQKETIEPELLDKIAKVLKVPVEAIKNFNEEATVNFISNTFTDQAVGGHTIHYNPVFNPTEKWIEAIAKNEKLYEALLREKDEKIALMERLLEKKK